MSTWTVKYNYIFGHGYEVKKIAFEVITQNISSWKLNIQSLNDEIFLYFTSNKINNLCMVYYDIAYLIVIDASQENCCCFHYINIYVKAA